jgi:CRP-like cAMP-binding protein
MDPEELQRVPLFAGLGSDDLDWLAERFHAVEVLSDHNVVREGDDAYAFFVVLEGSVDVHQQFERLRTLGPGDVFGEIGLGEPGTRSAHAVTRSRTRLAKLMAWDYRAMLERYPQVRAKLAETAEERSGADRPDDAADADGATGSS